MPDVNKGVNRPISFRPPKAMRKLIDELATKERRGPAQMTRLLVEDALVARGLWPPPEGAGAKRPQGGTGGES